MRQWWFVALLLSAMMAGCLGGDGTDDEPMDEEVGDESHDDGAGGDGDGSMDDAGETESTGDDDQSDVEEDDASPVVNTAPSAGLSASIEQGTVPFNVTFDMDGTDPEGDALTWTLDVTGDGTPETEGAALPANFTWTYDAAGEYNVTLSVNDGNETTVAELMINATAAIEETGPIYEFSGAYIIGGPHQGCVMTLFTLGVDSGATYIGFDVPAEVIGRTYTATWASTIPSAGSHIFWASDGSISQDDHADGTELTGTVPQATNAGASSCGGGLVEFSFVVF